MKNLHWADLAAEKIIREKGDKEEYVLASGITPSGVVHFGNFREVITVDLVARALRSRGKRVRFIFSWDDYDTFRKVPENMPNQEQLEEYLYQPIVDTPCPYGESSSYARYHESQFENQLTKMGILVEYLYQAQKYRNGEYSDSIRLALDNADKIREILNIHRTSPLTENYLPVSIYCERCNTDHQTQCNSWDGEILSYSCENCSYEGDVSFRHQNIKLPWRIDWAMRWAYEQVDFEPGGKDHSSEGGSYTTACEIVKIFGGEAPTYLQYDFVSLQGGPGKLSSSSGYVITVDDLLNIYSPEMVRYIYANTKPNRDFSIDLGLGVLRIYEEFDRLRAVAFDSSLSPKKAEFMSRVYDFCLVEDKGEFFEQVSFRELCDTYQTYRCNVDSVVDYYEKGGLDIRSINHLRQRLSYVGFWLREYAPEEFKFSLNEESPLLDLTDNQRLLIERLVKVLDEKWDNLDGKGLQEEIYSIKNELEMEPAEVFSILYNILISKNQGPRLANFILSIPKDKVLSLLSGVIR